MFAESILKKEGFDVNFTVSPKGCGLAIEVDLNNEVFVGQLLKEHNIKYMKIVGVTSAKK